jgi:uncharacterized protein YbjT (DUF2867 family)
MDTESKKLSVIITGATGMVGEGVLLECLGDPGFERVLLVSRKPYGSKHPKLNERIVPNFLELDAVTEALAGYDACFFCAGVSSAGMSESDYSHVTYDTTLHFAKTLATIDPEKTFVYVSGSHTDGSERGRIMWARVKGKTENALAKLPFRKVYNFRPGFMRPTPGQRNVKGDYKIIGFSYPLLRLVLPSQVSTMRDVGLAMIKSVSKGYPRQVLEVGHINELAKA